MVSKPQIRFKGKASRELKTKRTRKYVSISICGTTQPLGLRWGFETTSRGALPFGDRKTQIPPDKRSKALDTRIIKAIGPAIFLFAFSLCVLWPDDLILLIFLPFLTSGSLP